jgi:hypothetical protein
MARSGIHFGDCGMTLHETQTAPVKWFGIPRLYCLIVLFAAVFTIAIKMAPDRKPFVNPKIVAEAYVWPIGCEKKIYMEGDYIAQACMKSEYYIYEWKRYGWHVTSKGFQGFYRVSNDAIDFNHCNVFIKRHCIIYNKISNVFGAVGENK